MIKKILTILALFTGTICFAENIHFNNEIFTLKYSSLAPATNGYGNEYFKNGENLDNWTKMIGIYYYPNDKDPIKFAQDFVKTIETTDNSMLLKMVQNKKTDKAAISFIVNGCKNAKKYFEYNIYKFEKHPDKGMMVLKHCVKYFFTNDTEIKQLAEKIRDQNDKYLELLITSPIPPIVEKDIDIRE